MSNYLREPNAHHMIYHMIWVSHSDPFSQSLLGLILDLKKRRGWTIAGSHWIPEHISGHDIIIMCAQFSSPSLPPRLPEIAILWGCISPQNHTDEKPYLWQALHPLCHCFYEKCIYIYINYFYLLALVTTTHLCVCISCKSQHQVMETYVSQECEGADKSWNCSKVCHTMTANCNLCSVGSERTLYSVLEAI